MATCRSCHAAIMWVPCGPTHEPLNVTPVLGGDFDFHTEAVLVTAQPDVVRFTSHRDTCPDRLQWIGNYSLAQNDSPRDRPGYVRRMGR